MRHPRAFPVLAALALLGCAASARADEISNPVAIFAGLDKITGRVVRFEAKVGETVQFGTLQVTPRVCYTKPPTETEQTVGFLQVDEVTSTKALKRIFSGWMFAASPGLNGIEHPIYDVWLLNCKGGVEVERTSPDTASAPPATGADNDAAAALGPPEPAAPATPRRNRRRSAAPAFTGPPIEVGNAPGEGPASSSDEPVADPIAPPGPLPPALIPRTRGRPSSQDDPNANDAGPGSDYNPY